jgi:hypothetical protein
MSEPSSCRAASPATTSPPSGSSSCQDTNALGTIFGGVILSHIDLASAVEARKTAARRWVTKAMREVEFHEPVFLGDIVNFFTETVRVGRTRSRWVSVRPSGGGAATASGEGHRGGGGAGGRRGRRHDARAGLVAARIRVGVLMGRLQRARDLAGLGGHDRAALPREVRRGDADTLALMAGNARSRPSCGRARSGHSAAGGRSAGPARPGAAGSFQEQIRSAAAAAPATEAIAVAAAPGSTWRSWRCTPYGARHAAGHTRSHPHPFVGSGTLASALAMDKAMAKKVFQAEGIPVPAGTVVHRGEFHLTVIA